MTLPATTAYVGTKDQAKRWSKPGTTSMLMKASDAKSMMVRCAGSLSAVGPPLIRRLSSAGSRFMRWRVMSDAAPRKTAR